MRSLARWMTGAVCAWMAIASGGTSYAQISGALNVRALPLPHASCPSATNAVPNDNVPDDSAFQCALALAPASGAEIYIPAGKYHLDYTLSVTNKSIAFRGEGQRITTLVWSGAQGAVVGIDFNDYTSPSPMNHQLTVKSMSLLRGSGYGGWAIRGVWPTPTDHRSRGGTSATISDVHISHENYGNETGQALINWGIGIQLGNAMGARISTFNIHLRNGEAIAPILIHAKSMGVSINDGDMGRATYGVLVQGESESVRIEDVEGSEHDIAFSFQTSGKYHVISNCHASLINQGIKFENGGESTLTDNFFYGRGAANKAGIEIYNPVNGGDGFEIRGNLLATFVDGILLDGYVYHSRVTGNLLAVTRDAIVAKNGVLWAGIIANDRSGSNIAVDNSCGCNVQYSNP